MDKNTDEKFGKLVAALVAAGKLSVEDAKHVTLREDSKGKFHIESHGLTHDAAQRFKAAMDSAGITANYTIKKSHEA